MINIRESRHGTKKNEWWQKQNNFILLIFRMNVLTRTNEMQIRLLKMMFLEDDRKLQIWYGSVHLQFIVIAIIEIE